MAKRAIVEHTAHVKPAVRIILAPLQGEKGPHVSRLYGKAEGRVVTIDPRFGNVAQTLLHELIHVEQPGWSETRVRRETAARWRRMGWREKATLLRMFGRAKLGGEE